MSDRLSVPDERLRHLYENKKLSLRAVGEHLCCSKATVYRALKRASIPVRTRQEGQWLVYERGERDYRPGDPTAALEYWRSHPKAAERRWRKAIERSAALRRLDALSTVVCAHCGQSFQRRRHEI